METAKVTLKGHTLTTSIPHLPEHDVRSRLLELFTTNHDWLVYLNQELRSQQKEIQEDHEYLQKLQEEQKEMQIEIEKQQKKLQKQQREQKETQIEIEKQQKELQEQQREQKEMQGWIEDTQNVFKEQGKEIEEAEIENAIIRQFMIGKHQYNEVGDEITVVPGSCGTHVPCVAAAPVSIPGPEPSTHAA